MATLREAHLDLEVGGGGGNDTRRHSIATSGGGGSSRSFDASEESTTTTEIVGLVSEEEEKGRESSVSKFSVVNLETGGGGGGVVRRDEGSKLLLINTVLKLGSRLRATKHVRPVVKNHWNSTLKRRRFENQTTGSERELLNLSGVNNASSRSVFNVDADSDVFDLMTTLSLAPPGMGGYGSPEKVTENLSAGFLEVMRDVIAREGASIIKGGAGLNN